MDGYAAGSYDEAFGEDGQIILDDGGREIRPWYASRYTSGASQRGAGKVKRQATATVTVTAGGGVASTSTPDGTITVTATVGPGGSIIPGSGATATVTTTIYPQGEFTTVTVTARSGSNPLLKLNRWLLLGVVASAALCVL